MLRLVVTHLLPVELELELWRLTGTVLETEEPGERREGVAASESPLELPMEILEV